MIYHSPSFDMKGFSSIGGILLTIDAAKMQAGKSRRDGSKLDTFPPSGASSSNRGPKRMLTSSTAQCAAPNVI